MTLYVSDLDGTLLRSDATLSERSRASLRRFLGEGLDFTVASARSVVSIRQMLGDLPLTLPVIEFNGAFISDLATGHHHVTNAIETATCGHLLEVIAEHAHAPLLSTFGGGEDRVHVHAPCNEGMHWYLDERRRAGDPRQRPIDDPRSCLDEEVVCITVIGREGELAALLAAVDAEHRGRVEPHLFENVYSPGWHWLTFHDQRATKDRAVRQLAETWGMERHEVVVFGDQVNDLKMFAAADRSYAVANAIAELREGATGVIGGNDEDGVVAFLEEELGRSRADHDDARARERTWS